MGYGDSVIMCKRAWWAGIRPRRQAFQHYGVDDMRLNFVDVYPSDCGNHDGEQLQIKLMEWNGMIMVDKKYIEANHVLVSTSVSESVSQSAAYIWMAMSGNQVLCIPKFGVWVAGSIHLSYFSVRSKRWRYLQIRLSCWAKHSFFLPLFQHCVKQKSSIIGLDLFCKKSVVSQEGLGAVI